MSDSGHIMDALARRHPAADWIFIPEIRVGTGFGNGNEQRIDAWAMHAWPSKRLFRVAYEIKVTRQDFLRELKQPLKRRAALLVSNLFYFATPEGLIKRDEVPIEAGLLEVSPEGKHNVVVEPPWREGAPPTWGFMASVYRTLNLGGVQRWGSWICACSRRNPDNGRACACGRSLARDQPPLFEDVAT